jgi:hypothetical protein
LIKKIGDAMFELTRLDVEDYNVRGYCIMRRVIPISLLGDLRREADKGRAIAREISGESAQRLQPVKRHAGVLDMRPFEDYAHLPALEKAFKELISPEACPGKSDTDRLMGTGVFYEPATRPWCTQWHRDWRDNYPAMDLEAFDRLKMNTRYFNQINCALYEDNCTWVVPGSHLRRDTKAEIARFPVRPLEGPDVIGKDDLGAEWAVMDYARSMPGGMEVRLGAGDLMLYRNSAWHIGVYLPYRRRTTIHDFVFSKEFGAFVQDPPSRRKADGSLDTSVLNPNADFAGV